MLQRILRLNGSPESSSNLSQKILRPAICSGIEIKFTGKNFEFE
jgi:hypothetical protein